MKIKYLTTLAYVIFIVTLSNGLAQGFVRLSNIGSGFILRNLNLENDLNNPSHLARLEGWDGKLISELIPIQLGGFFEGGLLAIQNTNPGDCAQLTVSVYTSEDNLVLSSNRITVFLGTECQPASLFSLGFSGQQEDDPPCSEMSLQMLDQQFINCSNDILYHFVESRYSVQKPGAAFIEFTDLDSDGDLDVLSLANTGRYYTILQLTGGKFTVETGPETNLWLPHDLDVGDLDGDGDVDVVVVSREELTSESSHRRTIWLNDGFGGFHRSFQSLGASTNDTSPFLKTHLSDIDADGDLDAFVIDTNFGAFPGQWAPSGGGLWLNDGTGVFSLASMVDVSLVTGELETLADITGDGLPDLIFWSQPDFFNFEIRFKINNGGQSFGLSQKIQLEHPRGGLPTSIEVFDFNNDGLNDIVANYPLCGFLLWFNEGNAQYSFTDVDNLGGYIHESADFNQDGLLDILYADGQGNYFIGWNIGGVALYPGPRFVPRQVSQGRVIRARDFDGDGDQDLVRLTDSWLEFYLNNSVFRLQNMGVVDGDRVKFSVFEPGDEITNSNFQIIRSQDLESWETVRTIEPANTLPLFVEEDLNPNVRQEYFSVRLVSP